MKKIFIVPILIFCLQVVCFAEDFKVFREKQNYVAENKFYRINFSKTGSIDEIIFRDSGKGIKSKYLSHDSLTLNAARGFRLRNDTVTEGNIKEVSKVEIQLILNVKYKETPANVTVKYVYTFYAGKPVIKVSISLNQDKDITWLLIRLNEFGIENGYFSGWAVGENEKNGSLSKDTGTQKATNWKKGYSWSALFSDEDALGIIGLDKDSKSFIYIYGPEKQYINGKYGKWKSREIKLEQYLYIGPSDGGYKPVQKWAQKLFNAK